MVMLNWVSSAFVTSNLSLFGRNTSHIINTAMPSAMTIPIMSFRIVVRRQQAQPRLWPWRRWWDFVGGGTEGP